MVERIVVPLDGSEIAELALTRARALCREHSAPIHLVRVIDVAGTHGYSTFLAMERAGHPAAADAEESQARAYLEAVKRQLGGDGILATAETLRGHVVQQIVNLVQAGDLVVMTTHGKGRAPRWLLGRVAEELRRRCRVPVEFVTIDRTHFENLHLSGHEPGQDFGAL